MPDSKDPKIKFLGTFPATASIPSVGEAGALEDTDPTLESIPLTLEDLDPALRRHLSASQQAKAWDLAYQSARRSVWAAALAGSGALAGTAGLVGALLEPIPLVVAADVRTLVLTTVAAAFGLAIGLGALTYGLCRLAHPRAITGGRHLVAPALALLVLVVVLGGELGLTRPWAFPPAAVKNMSPRATELVLISHGLARGMIAYERGQPVAYFETTSGKWFRTPAPAGGESRFLAAFERVTALGPATTPATLSAAFGAAQVDALGTAREELWLYAAALVVLASALAILQRVRWSTGPFEPPISQRTILLAARAYRFRS